MWEWRVFFHGFGADIWQLLQIQPLNTSTDNRTDVYLVCTAGAGVKLRAQGMLEVKLRSCRHECGAEQWDKVTGWTWPGRGLT